MQIQLNDEWLICDDGLTVLQFFEQHDLAAPGVALALNQRILPQACWEEQLLQDNDSLTLFQVIAGG